MEKKSLFERLFYTAITLGVIGATVWVASKAWKKGQETAKI